jgi:phosphotransferase system enzyme I (PtsP)
MALLGLGFRRLSVSPNALGRIKAMIRSLDLGRLAAYLETIRRRPDRTLRHHLRAFALDHRVAI